MKLLQATSQSYSQSVNNRWKKFVRSGIWRGEEGSIEPALVLIPLLILILSTLQIASGVLARTTATFASQSALYSQALFSNEVESTGAAPLPDPQSNGATSSGSAVGTFGAPGNSTLSTSATPLPGGGSLVSGNETFEIPSLTPLLPGGDRFNVRTFVMKEGSL